MRAVKHLPAALVVAVFIYTGLRGIDFGFHWDEDAWQIRPVQRMVSSGLLLPRAYLYPSFNRWVVLLPALGTGIAAGVSGQSVREVQATMTSAFDRPDYLLSVRTLFLLISALTLVWIYLTGLVLDREWWQALIACAAFGLTWEFAYHARWVATDTPTTQFAALTLLFLALNHRTKKTGWLFAAAIAAGFCTGTKYPGVVVLATVLVAGALSQPLRPLRPQLTRAVALGFTAFAAYLITTPGTFLNPFDFWEQLRDIDKSYSNGHYGYTVEKGLPHLGHVLEYFLFDFFSPYRAIAVPAFAATLVGGYLRLKDDRKLGLILISFPVFFLLFFCWKYRVFIVRNDLLITPFLALLLSRAVAEGLKRLPTLKARQIAGGMLGLVAVLHAVWLWTAGESIRVPDALAQAREAVEFVGGHPGQQFRLSPKVRALAQQQGLSIPANTVESGENAVVFFVRAEGPPPTRWTVNDPFLVQAVFGPREINFNWYSTWEGQDRVVVMTVDKARAAGIALAN